MAEHERENENEQDIQMDTWNVPHFEWTLPLMKTPEGAYIPIYAICEMLGINPAAYTGVACRQYRPPAVRKLPVRDGTRAPRTAWCLKFDATLSWLWGFYMDNVAPERRPALLALQREMAEVTGKAYVEMQERFKSTRRDIYRGLLACQRMLATFAETEEKSRSWTVTTDGDGDGDGDTARAAFRALLEKGIHAYEVLAAELRAVLAKMMRGPVLDALRLDDDNNVIDTMAMPLLPVIPDLRKVNVQMRRVEAWSHSFRAFALQQGMPGDYGAPD